MVVPAAPRSRGEGQLLKSDIRWVLGLEFDAVVIDQRIIVERNIRKILWSNAAINHDLRHSARPQQSDCTNDKNRRQFNVARVGHIILPVGPQKGLTRIMLPTGHRIGNSNQRVMLSRENIEKGSDNRPRSAISTRTRQEAWLTQSLLLHYYINR